LDEVEPRFFHPLEQWQSYGTFSVYLNFDSSDLEQDIFYFCHVSHDMGTRGIRLVDGLLDRLVKEQSNRANFDSQFELRLHPSFRRFILV